MATILLVEDEATLVQTIAYTLRREGYSVVTAGDGPTALTLARAARPDVVVLDLMLPGLDGFEVCRRLRAESAVPILILSARDTEVDRVVGLEIGADDYLAKPFSLRELVARIRALLRRVRLLAEASAAERPPLQVGDLTIDPASRRVWRNGQELQLKPREFDLLLFLARHRGQVFSREQLLDRVWGYEHVVDSRTVDVHVRWLRAKIEDDPRTPRRLQTVRGVGYRLVG